MADTDFLKEEVATRVDIPGWAIEGVKEGRTQIDITITPDTKNIVISPWRPYEMKCPYGK